MLYNHNKRHGVQTTGIHRYRHTFAKQWILNGGNVVSLSKLLGHSSLEITQNYIHLLVSDISKQGDEFNVLDSSMGRKGLGWRRDEGKVREDCSKQKAEQMQLRPTLFVLYRIRLFE